MRFGVQIEQSGARSQDRVLVVCVVARRRTTRIGSSRIGIASMAMIVTNGPEHFRVKSMLRNNDQPINSGIGLP